MLGYLIMIWHKITRQFLDIHHEVHDSYTSTLAFITIIQYRKVNKKLM